MTTYGYVAALPSKEAEHKALINSQSHVGYFLPILHLPPVSTTSTTPDVQSWLNRQCVSVARARAGDTACLDLWGAEIPEEVPYDTATKPTWDYLYSLAQHVSVKMMPVIRLDDSSLTLATAGVVASTIGAVLRLNRANCLSLSANTDDVPQRIREVANTARIQPSEIRLVLDMEDIGQDVDATIKICVSALRRVASIALWRSVSLCGTSAPVDTSKIGFGWSRFARNEYAVWQGVRQRMPDFIVHYGDYGGFPALRPKSVGFPKHPTLRYTTKSEILIGRHQQQMGESFSGFRSLCQQLVGSDAWESELFSWGDRMIYDIARGVEKSGGGGGPGWRTIALSHHFARVAADLESIGQSTFSG